MIDKNEKNPRLFILMRTDMASMNPGKAMAQAGHAGTMFMHEMHEYIAQGSKKANEANSTILGYKDWLGARGFGTKIVLGVETPKDLIDRVNKSIEEGYMGGVVLDETYPIRDGEFTHFVPVYTCGYVFSHNGVSPEALKALKLHS